MPDDPMPVVIDQHTAADMLINAVDISRPDFDTGIIYAIPVVICLN